MFQVRNFYYIVTEEQPSPCPESCKFLPFLRYVQTFAVHFYPSRIIDPSYTKTLRLKLPEIVLEKKEKKNPKAHVHINHKPYLYLSAVSHQTQNFQQRTKVTPDTTGCMLNQLTLEKHSRRPTRLTERCFKTNIHTLS